MVSANEPTRAADQNPATASLALASNAQSEPNERFANEEVATAAYYIWQKEGCPCGRDKEHWRMAIKQLEAQIASFVPVPLDGHTIERGRRLSALWPSIKRFVSGMGQRPDSASDSREIRIFLAYRRGSAEGDEYVAVLNKNLDGREIAARGGPRYRLKTFFDRFTPFSPDWKNYWNIYLRTAGALIVVCTEGVARRRSGGDFLHQEIDTWLRYRRTCPILVDAKNLGRDAVPLQILSRWPNAERLDWPQHGDEGRLYRRIEEGILLSAVDVNQQDLSRIRLRNTLLRWASYIAIGLALVASIFGFRARLARFTAEFALEEAVNSRSEAVSNAKEALKQAQTANSRRLAAEADATISEQLDLALLLAADAFEVEPTYQASSSLYRGLTTRPGLLAFLHGEQETDALHGAAIDPHGRVLASGYSRANGAGGVIFWDIMSRRLTAAPIVVPEGGVYDVTFSPDGRVLASVYRAVDGGRSGVILLTTGPPGRMIEEPITIPEGVAKVAKFSPNGQTLAIGYDAGGDHAAGGIVLWNVTTRVRLPGPPLLVPEGAVFELAFTPDGKRLASRQADGIVLWNLDTRTRLGPGPLKILTGDVELGDSVSLAISPNGRMLAAGFDFAWSTTGGVALWDLETLRRLQDSPLDVREGGVYCVEFTPDGKALAAGFDTPYGGGVLFWDLATLRRLPNSAIDIPEGGVDELALAPDNNTLAIGFSRRSDRSISSRILWDRTADQRLADPPLILSEGSSMGVAFSPDSKWIASGYLTGDGDGGVALWDLASAGRTRSPLLTVPEGSVVAVTFSTDEKFIASGYSRHETSESVGGVVVWNTSTRRRLSETPLIVPEGGVTRVAFAPDGKTLAAGYDYGYQRRNLSGGVVLWTSSNWKRIEPLLDVPEGAVKSIAFGRGGKIFAAGYSTTNAKGGVILWDASNWRRLTDQPLVDLTAGVQDIAFSHDGRTLAVGFTSSQDNGVSFWNVTDWEKQEGSSLSIATGGITALAINPASDELAVAAGGDTGVVLWDLKSHERMSKRPLTLPNGYSNTLAFSPDGAILATGYDGGILLWRSFSAKSWLNLAGRVANRNLSTREWREFMFDKPYRATFRDFPEAPALAPRSSVSNRGEVKTLAR
jgi:WD40 repeat protein